VITSPVPVLPPDNDSCDGASREIELDSGVPVEGSTLGSTLFDDVPFCSSQYESFAGVWYTVIGTGNDIGISLCDVGENYNSWAVSILEGSCNALSCIHYNEFYSNCEYDIGLGFSWPTEDGKVYYLFVSPEFQCFISVSYYIGFLSYSVINISFFTITGSRPVWLHWQFPYHIPSPNALANIIAHNYGLTHLQASG
jgi:hypothetical protein